MNVNKSMRIERWRKRGGWRKRVRAERSEKVKKRRRWEGLKMKKSDS